MWRRGRAVNRSACNGRKQGRQPFTEPGLDEADAHPAVSLKRRFSKIPALTSCVLRPMLPQIRAGFRRVIFPRASACRT